MLPYDTLSFKHYLWTYNSKHGTLLMWVIITIYKIGETIMRHKFFTKKACSMLLIASVLVTSSGTASYAAEKKLPALNVKKKITLELNNSKTLKVKKSGVKKLLKVNWKSSDKKVVSVKKAKKFTAKVTALETGKAVITATVKYKKTNKALSKKLKCTITVLDSNNNPVTSPTVIPSILPSSTPGATAATPAPATEAPTKGPDTLLAALKPYVKNIGTCISYSGGWGGQQAVADANTTAFIKENYNSLTAENEMKPNSILGWQANLISVEQAKNQGYIIPDGYSEPNVPQLNYGNIDKLCNYAKENGIRVRYHGLLWHEQSSNWFFRTDFNSNGDYVTPEIMDLRNEFYIKNVMNHVYTSDYKDVVYAWDVLNEYSHMPECIFRIGRDKGNEVKCYYEIYKEKIFADPSNPERSTMLTNPEYVKKAFKAAYEILEKYNLTDSVELVYNDYDTNIKEVRDTAIGVCTYINSKDELNPEGKKYVTTIGMQGHDKVGKYKDYLDVEREYLVSDHADTLRAIKEAGLNMQYTELDLGLNGQSVETQIKYWEDLIGAIITEAQNGANVTGLTWWGMTDAASWRGSAESPLLCGSSVSDKKPAYFAVVNKAYSFLK